MCPGDALLADCGVLEAIGLAEFHQSDCPLLLRKQLHARIFVWQCVLSLGAAAPFD